MGQLRGLPPQAAQIVQGLKQCLLNDHATLEAYADAVLAERENDVDAAAAPFIMAALQVYWTSLAADFNESLLPAVSPHGVCHLCGSRSEEHTSELQSLMRISYAVFCLKKNKNNNNIHAVSIA